MQVNQPLVSLISVNYNQALVTLDMIKSVLDESYSNIELIIVDNGSKESLDTYLPKDSNIRFIRSERNLGFAGGNNLALPYAKGKYLFYINNDTILSPGCIGTLVQYLETHPNVGIISPLICYDLEQTNHKEIIQFVAMTALHVLTGRNITVGRMQENKGQFQEPVETAYVHGAAMMVRSEITEKVGVMDDHFFLYYEEMDWSARIKKAGYDILTIPTAKIYHRESLTVGEDSPLKTYFHTRNRIYFVRKNFGFAAKCAFFMFFSLVTLPKNVLKLAITGKAKKLRAFLLGFWHHLNPGNKNEFEDLLRQSKAIV
jgi:GT2 family glycosyltransferase